MTDKELIFTLNAVSNAPASTTEEVKLKASAMLELVNMIESKAKES